MAALAVSVQLDLVDREEIHLAFHWHGLDRADPVCAAAFARRRDGSSQLGENGLRTMGAT
jgi:hypothetical protein